MYMVGPSRYKLYQSRSLISIYVSVPFGPVGVFIRLSCNPMRGVCHIPHLIGEKHSTYIIYM